MKTNSNSNSKLVMVAPKNRVGIFYIKNKKFYHYLDNYDKKYLQEEVNEAKMSVKRPIRTFRYKYLLGQEV